MLQAVKLNGYAIRYASKELKSDKEIVFEAFKKDYNAFKFASKELLNNK